MLPKKNRLKKKEVEAVLKKGKTYRSIFLFLKLTRNNLPISRFSVIVPVSLSKKTTKRNKIKRQIRESLRKKLPKISPGIDGILMALPGAIERDYREIEKEVDKLIEISSLRLQNS
jgi:ribonuclease P protein component